MLVGMSTISNCVKQITPVAVSVFGEGIEEAKMDCGRCRNDGVGVMLAAPSNARRQHRPHRTFHRFNNSALDTTLTLDIAMAAPANTGLSIPNAASGIPMML
jgi:hypothetical protein